MNQHHKGAPPPGVYATVVDVCPYCGGVSKSGLVVSSSFEASSASCPVCGGTGRVAGLVPLDQAVLAVLDAYGLVSKKDLNKALRRFQSSLKKVLSQVDERQLFSEGNVENEENFEAGSGGEGMLENQDRESQEVKV